MNRSPDETAILSAVSQFQEISRYHGVMPRKHTLAWKDEAIEALVSQGLLEWAEFTYGCGKELKGLRLTPEGQCVLEEGQPSPSLDTPPEEEKLPYEYLLILQDVFHFSHMPRYHRMMPVKKAQKYLPTDMDDLVNRGYILKIKLKTASEGSMKGYVISAKGERALKGAKMG